MDYKKRLGHFLSSGLNLRKVLQILYLALFSVD